MITFRGVAKIPLDKKIFLCISKISTQLAFFPVYCYIWEIGQNLARCIYATVA